ncbi:MAG: flagellar motor switch protein FliN [Fimbriimonadaceae bacterium]|nr:flagellar motor switch protein FliN [Fimbriimonadaceae bacterium]
MTQLFTQLQSALWTSVARAVTDAGGPTVGLAPMELLEPDQDSLLQEVASSAVVATISLTGLGTGIFCIPEASCAAFALAPSPEAWSEILEAIAKGVCAGLSDPSGDSPSLGKVTVTGPLGSLPDEFRADGPTIRLIAKATGENGSGTVSLILDAASCATICGEDAEPPARKTMEGVTSDLGLLFDVPLELSVEIGRVKIPVRDVVDLGPGSIVEIDKAAGEPVEVLLNGHLVAKGEVVVIDDNFGVRITEIMKPADRKSSEAA